MTSFAFSRRVDTTLERLFSHFFTTFFKKSTSHFLFTQSLVKFIIIVVIVFIKMPPNVHRQHSQEANGAEVESNQSILNKLDNLHEISLHDLSSWATVDPSRLGVDATPYAVSNLVDGHWTCSATSMEIIHPLNADAPAPLFTIPDTSVEELPAYVESLKKATKSGLHNPLKHPERYVLLGEVSRQVGNLLSTPAVAEFFTQLIVTCVPKSYGMYVLSLLLHTASCQIS